MDEDAGRRLGIGDVIRQPFVKDQDYKVAEESQQEDDLRNENQENLVVVLEVAVKRKRANNRGSVRINVSGS